MSVPTITEPGVYSMPAEDYHHDPCEQPSLSSGIAKVLLSRSPLHAWYAHPRLNPDYEESEKAAFDLGSATHALVLEGADRMEVIDAADYRTKAAQEARDAARMAGKHPVLAKQYRDVQRMASIAKEAIDKCADLGGINLADGVSEQVVIWKEGNAWCRSRPDWMSRDRRIQLSYKTTASSANPSDFDRMIENMGYDLQDAFYLRGNRATGAPEDSISLTLVQENEAPYACAWVGLDPSFMAMADAKAATAIALWQKCINLNNWPGYSPRVHWISPPAYALAKWEEREAVIGIPYDPAKLFGGMK